MRTWIFVAIGALALVGVIFSKSAISQTSRTYYIDFQAGSDAANGTSQGSAWKHAPGDPRATDAVARFAPQAGDKFLFRAGVIYRGAITVRANATASNPVTYEGQGWGSGRAILSGRDPFSISPRPCGTEPECASLPGAPQLVVIDLPERVTQTSQLTLDGHNLILVERPRPANPFWFDDTGSFATADPSDLTQLSDGKTWQIESDFFSKTLQDSTPGDSFILLQSYGNMVIPGQPVAYDRRKDTFQFVADGFRRNDPRKVQFALANHPRLISQPWEYATIANGTKIIVAAPQSSSQLEISKRQTAFLAVGQRGYAIHGFEIVGFSGGPKDYRGGVALVGDGSTDVTFSDNDVHDLESWAGSGAIGSQPFTNLIVTGNRFHDLPHGSGLRIGKTSGLRIVNNDFENIGRTGILIMGTQGAVIDHNTMRGLYGTHGNGISVYKDNRNSVVTNNLVADATRAVTFEGAGPEDPLPNNIIFRGNIFQTDVKDGVALQSWGGNTNGVLIERNIILFQKDGIEALRLSGRDQNVTVRKNIIDGYSGYPVPLVTTTVSDNIFVSRSRGSTEDNDEDSDFKDYASALIAGKPDPKACAFLMADAGPGAGIGPLDLCRK